MRVIILTASTMVKTINGTKFSGRCITGYDPISNRIIRFVGNAEGAPMGPPRCNLFRPLEIVDIPVIGECPKSCQTENVIGDYENARWQGKYKQGIVDLYKKIQTIPATDSSFMLDVGKALVSVDQYQHSLELIKVEDLLVYPIPADGKNKIRCDFQYDGKQCKSYSVTDPVYTDLKNEMMIGDSYLAISIPSDTPSGINYYKFVAAIYPI